MDLEQIEQELLSTLARMNLIRDEAAKVGLEDIESNLRNSVSFLVDARVKVGCAIHDMQRGIE